MPEPVTPAERGLLEQAYAAFNARDLDRLLAALDPAVAWANGMEGGHVHGRAGARAYWTRQWAQVDPHVEPLAMARDTEGRVVIEVHQVVHELTGKLLLDRTVRHAYTFRGGLIARMDILPDAEGSGPAGAFP